MAHGVRSFLMNSFVGISVSGHGVSDRLTIFVDYSVSS